MEQEQAQIEWSNFVQVTKDVVEDHPDTGFIQTLALSLNVFDEYKVYPFS